MNDKLLTDFKGKLNKFNGLFSPQYTPIDIGSVIPSSSVFLTNGRLSTTLFDDKDLVKIVRCLDVNKSDGHDNFSIRVMKICEKSLIKLLTIIFDTLLIQKYFLITSESLFLQLIKKTIKNS